MTIFDLLFIIVFLGSVGLLLSVIAAAMRRQRVQVLRRAVILGSLLLIYFGALGAVSAFSSGIVLGPGETLWSDDWGIAAISATHETHDGLIEYNIQLRISSRAGRIAQQERGVAVYATDDTGKRYASADSAAEIPLDTRLQPLQSIDLTRRFTLPVDALHPRLVISRGCPFPGSLIIAGPDSLFHAKPSVRLELLPTR